ncbi:MAG TPA: hypothetical protein VN748_01375 [Pseudonocardiaceae bacterium]|nr:hypothetical protein [Pseudonocardiaceae bacterium]
MAFDVEFGIVSVPLPNRTTGFGLLYQATGAGRPGSPSGEMIGIRIKTAPTATNVGRGQRV